MNNPTQAMLRASLLVGLTLAVGLTGRSTPFAQQRMAPYRESLPKSTARLDMVPVSGGQVTIGGKSVTVAPFYIAKTETPWEAFDAFQASGEPSPPYDRTVFGPDAIARPSRSYLLPDLGWGHNGYPVINVSAENAEMFCRWLSSVTKKKYRLPTEAEWEMACRADKPANWKPTKAEADQAAWYKPNSKETTHPVGKKAANAWGIHDMLGNAGEWAKDMAGKPVLCGGTFQDDLAMVSPATRRYWAPEWQDSDPQMPKSRWWLSDGPFAGFRVVCEP